MNKLVLHLYIFLLLFVVSSSSAFAQNQPPCSGGASITDTSQAQSGVLVVVSNSAQASFDINGTKTYHGSGYYWVQQGIPSGTYTIIWSAVNGCGTPLSETKTTDAHGSIAFAGNYKNLNAPAGYGTIIIKTNLNMPAMFTVSGPAIKTAQGTGFTWASAPAGMYTVSYGTVAGYDAPRSETSILAPGGTLNFYGNYSIKKTTPSDIQYFTIESKPVSGADVYVDGISVGKTPAQATAYFGSRSKIRCSLEGYEDFNGEYRAPDPGSGVIVKSAVIYCLLTAKANKPSQTSGQIVTPQTSIIPPAPPQQDIIKPQGFFMRLWRSFFSIFRK